MQPLHQSHPSQALQNSLHIDCQACRGLCCTALYFAKSEGFPADKAAGAPCRNLAADFRCAIHKDLAVRGLNGCLAYDCFGAGQKVVRELYRRADWRTSPALAEEMFSIFLVVFRLHQMLWYLAEAASLAPAVPCQAEIHALIEENQRLTRLPPKALLQFQLNPYHQKVSRLLKNLCARICTAGKQSQDAIGKRFRGKKTRQVDFSMCLLIAADLRESDLYGASFLGADLRDANLKDADLRESIFLTQGQINAAKGNAGTKLPVALHTPSHWL